MRDHLLAFVGRLRSAGLRVSVAETLDAMAAVEQAGVAREVLREALAATLVKDEEDRARFDAAFDAHFPLLPADGGSGRRGKGTRPGGGADDEPRRGTPARGAGGGSGGAPPPDARVAPRTAPRDVPRPAPGRPEPPAERDARRGVAAHETRVHATRPLEPAPHRSPVRAGRAPEPHRPPSSPLRPGRQERPGAPQTTVPPLARRPLSELDPDDLELAHAAAREIGRRFLARVSRRERRARRGRVDIRRTIRRAVARGGALLEIERRGRRPGKPKLVVLCDVSGSVARASELLLAMLGACEGAFARVARFAFVDRLVPIDFADGHIRPEGPLDLHAFSDLGSVLVELERQAEGWIDRDTVLLVLGDARNNRRPARADALRRLAARARAVVLAVPEPRVRWNTGDSALALYAPAADPVLEATSLLGLVAALREAARG